MKHYTYTPDCETYDRAMRRVSRYGGLAYGKLLSMQVVGTDDCPYGATDGRKLYLNPAGIDKLKQTSNAVGYLAFLLVHEALHAQLSHATRLRKLADPMTSNIAADYIINAMIADMNTAALAAGAKVVPFPFIPNVLLDRDLSQDRHVIELYNILKTKQEQEAQQRAAQQPQPQPDNDDTEEDEQDECSSGADESESSDEADSGDTDSTEESDRDDGGNESEDSDSKADGEAGADEAEGGDAGAGTADGDEPKSDEEILNDWVGTTAGHDLAEPALDEGETTEEFADSVDQDNEQVILNEQLAQSAGTTGGGNVRDIVAQRRQWTGLDWSDYVKQWMSDRLDEGWNKPLNVRTFAATGLVEDDRESNNIGELAIVIDTSISVPSSVVQEMLDATQDSMDTLRPKRIHLISHDTQVRDTIELEAGDTVPRSLAGGGGTLFGPVFNHIAEACPDIDGIIYLTDLEVNDWNTFPEPQVPVLWLDWCPYTDHPVPFGERIKVSCA